MKKLTFKGVKLHPAMAEKVIAYAEKAYRCSYEQLSTVEQYDCVMACIDLFDAATDVYYDTHQGLVFSGIPEISLQDLVDNLDLEPQDSYCPWQQLFLCKKKART